MYRNEKKEVFKSHVHSYLCCLQVEYKWSAYFLLSFLTWSIYASLSQLSPNDINERDLFLLLKCVMCICSMQERGTQYSQGSNAFQLPSLFTKREKEDQ